MEGEIAHLKARMKYIISKGPCTNLVHKKELGKLKV